MNMHTFRQPTNITNERLIHAGLMTNLFYSQTTQSSAPNYSITPFVSEPDSLFREFLRFLLFSHKRIIYYCIIITKEYQYKHTQAGPPMMVGYREDNSSPSAVVVRSHSHPAPIHIQPHMGCRLKQDARRVETHDVIRVRNPVGRTVKAAMSTLEPCNASASEEPPSSVVQLREMGGSIPTPALPTHSREISAHNLRGEQI